MADNNKVREEVKALTERLEAGIQDLYTSHKYEAYLDTMSKFHKYSLRNTVLIHLQMPDASQVAGFNTWKNEFERHVMKGQKGIRIFAPAPFTVKKEMEKLDPDTQTPLLDNTGKPIVEEVEETIPAFRPVSVFDVSQTDGKPLPSLAEDLIGDVRQYEAFMDALKAVSLMPIAIETLDPDTDGECRYDSRTIAIREGMSEVQTVSAVIHEMTHAELHDYNEQIDRQEQEAGPDGSPQQDGGEVKPKPRSRRAEEVEAESVSYVVCQHYGIETGANSFGYIANWSKDKELNELKASLEIIRKTAISMIDRIDGKYTEICKERGIDLTPAQDTTEQTADTPAPEQPAPAKPEQKPQEQAASSTRKRKYFITERQREQAERMAAKWEARAEAFYAGGEGWGLDTADYCKTPEEAEQATERAEKIHTAINSLTSGSGTWADVQVIQQAVANRDELDAQIVAKRDEGGQAAPASEVDAPDLETATSKPEQTAQRYIVVSEDDGHFVQDTETGSYYSENALVVWFTEADAAQLKADELNEEAIQHSGLSSLQRFRLDLHSFTDERRAERGVPPYQHESFEEFERSFMSGDNGQIRSMLEEWAKDNAYTEQAEALLSQLDTVEQELWPGPSLAPMRDQRAQFGLDLAQIMSRFYEEHPASTETGTMANTSPNYITHQIEIGNTQQIEQCLNALANQSEFSHYADMFRVRLSTLEPLQANEFDLGYDHNENGLTVWNRLEIRDGDYAAIAHISPERKVTYLDNTLPDEVKAQIEQTARTTETLTSATPDTLVVNTTAEPVQSEQAASMRPTDLQQKGIEIAQRYEKLPLQDRMNIIAETFGCKTASIRTSPCTGKWRGTSDISLDLDNGASLFIGNFRTPQAKTAKAQNECVNGTLACYNPEILAEIKARAIPALLKREAEDNAIAAQKGLKPYTFLNVEMNDGNDKQSSGYLGWYYATVAVDGKIFALIETGLNYDIARGVLSESRPNYFVAGALKDNEVDFVFNNVGHSSTSGLYKLHLSDNARERAEKTLNGRLAVEITEQQKDFEAAKTPEKQYDLGYGHMGNGLTVWNRAEEKNGDYVTVAHIDPDRSVTFYDKDMPDSVKARIEQVALTSDMTVSATQDTPVFRTPAQTAELERGEPERDPDEILPDPGIGLSERDLYGYTDPTMLPMLQERALELFDADHTIYLLYPDGVANMAFDHEDIETHDGIFGIEAEEWQAAREYQDMITSTKNSEASKEALLIYGKDDTYGIYQLKGGDEMRDYRWESLANLDARGLSVDRANYELVYTAPLTGSDTLDSLYEKFNVDRPADFRGHSLSMSDVIVLRQDGAITSHYIDRADIKELSIFLGHEKSSFEKLAKDIDDFMHSFDQHGYDDSGVDREQSVAMLATAIQSGDGYAANVKDILSFAVEDSPEYGKAAAALLERLNEHMPPVQQPEIAATEVERWENDHIADISVSTQTVAPPTTQPEYTGPTVAELDAQVRAGQQISLLDLAKAVKNETPKTTGKKPSAQTKRKEEKPSIIAQLQEAKKAAAQGREQENSAPKRNNDREV